MTPIFNRILVAAGVGPECNQIDDTSEVLLKKTTEMEVWVKQLGLQFIARNIIVIGFFDLEDVERHDGLKEFFSANYSGNYRAYNFSTDLHHEELGFEVVEQYVFNKANPCALDILLRFCSNAESYLAAKSKNIIVLMDTGLDRAFLMCACYLLHSGSYRTANDAVKSIATFGAMLMPSQFRLVKYYERLLRSADGLKNYTYKITHIRFRTVPLFEASIVANGCTPYAVISLQGHSRGTSSNIAWQSKTIFHQKLRESSKPLPRFNSDERYCHMDLASHDVLVRGDVNLSFFHGFEKICAVSFHTAFVEGNYLSFDKAVVDLACRDIHHLTFDETFQVEVFLHRVADKPDLNSIALFSHPRSGIFSVNGEEVDSHVKSLVGHDFTLFDDDVPTASARTSRQAVL